MAAGAEAASSSVWRFVIAALAVYLLLSIAASVWVRVRGAGRSSRVGGRESARRSGWGRWLLTMPDTVDGVRARIGEMAARDPEGARFGADTHRYELAPALPEAEIRTFEEVHGIHLPAEYRSFVAEVGNGPAGPGHGLMPLTVPRPEAGEEWAAPRPCLS